jgi:hypothetical protein
MRQLHGNATILFSTVLVLLGIVLVVETTLLGGGGLGYLLGAMFAFVGVLRLYLTQRKA